MRLHARLNNKFSRANFFQDYNHQRLLAQSVLSPDQTMSLQVLPCHCKFYLVMACEAIDQTIRKFS